MSDDYTAKCRDGAWAGSFSSLPGLSAGLYHFSLIVDGRPQNATGSLRVG
jgi:hypothetical protein